MTTTLKVTVGRLRPSFLQVCQPVLKVRSAGGPAGSALAAAVAATASGIGDIQGYGPYLAVEPTVPEGGNPPAQTATQRAEYICSTAKDDKTLINNRMSFPSGHTSNAFCGLFFLSCFILGQYGPWHRRSSNSIGSTGTQTTQATQPTQASNASQADDPNRMSVRRSLHLWLLAALPIAMATYIGLSRISDYRHHPSDVAAGALIGGLFAYIGYDYIFRPIWSVQSDHLRLDHIGKDVEDVNANANNNTNTSNNISSNDANMMDGNADGPASMGSTANGIYNLNRDMTKLHLARASNAALQV